MISRDDILNIADHFKGDILIVGITNTWVMSLVDEPIDVKVHLEVIMAYLTETLFEININVRVELMTSFHSLSWHYSL